MAFIDDAVSLTIVLLIIFYAIFITKRYKLMSIGGWKFVLAGLIYMEIVNVFKLVENQVSPILEGTLSWSVLYILLRFEVGILLVSLGFYQWIPQVVRSREDELRLTTERNLALLYLDLMGHDIRNNLQVVSMSAGIIADVTEDVMTSGMLDNIRGAVEKCDEIIMKVKTTSDLPSSTLKKRSLRTILSNRCESFADKNRDVVTSLEIGTDSAIVMGNDFIESLLDNLLENAVEHNTRTEKFVWIRLTGDESGYWISIADNGPGIPEDRRESIFEMTTRYGGIGLHQSKHIVEKHGGQIAIHERVEGDYSQGVVVEVFLPSPERMEIVPIA